MPNVPFTARIFPAFLLKTSIWVTEMARWVKSLAAEHDHLKSVPETHVLGRQTLSSDCYRTLLRVLIPYTCKTINNFKIKIIKLNQLQCVTITILLQRILIK